MLIGDGYRFTGHSKDMQRLAKTGKFQCDICSSEDIRKFQKEADPIQENYDLLKESLAPIEALLRSMSSIIVPEYVILNYPPPILDIRYYNRILEVNIFLYPVY